MAGEAGDGTVWAGGGCLCGAVRFEVTAAPQRVTVCHCRWCQKRTGSAFGVQAVFDRAAVAFTASPPRVHRHHSDESGRWLDRQFCETCGTGLGLTLEAVPEIVALFPGVFDDPALIERLAIPVRNIYMRSACGWSRVPEGAETYPEHFRPEPPSGG